MKAQSLNLRGMVISGKIEPIFNTELVRLRQKGTHKGDYLIGFIKSGVKYIRHGERVIDHEALKGMKFTVYDNFLDYEKVLTSRTGDEIMRGEQI